MQFTTAQPVQGKELLALRKRPLQTLCIFMVIHVFQKNSYNTLSRSLQKISLKKCKFGCFLYSNFSFQSTYLFQPYRQSIKFSLSCKATLYLILGLCNAQVNCKIILHCRKNVTWCGASWQTFFVCLAILLWQLIEKDVSLLIILRTFFDNISSLISAQIPFNFYMNKERNFEPSLLDC